MKNGHITAIDLPMLRQPSLIRIRDRPLGVASVCGDHLVLAGIMLYDRQMAAPDDNVVITLLRTTFFILVSCL